MTIAAVREKLYDYIRVADDDKVKAIYQLLQSDVEGELQWWKDLAFGKELDKRYAAWASGSEKGHSTASVLQAVDQLKEMRLAT